MTCVNKSQVGGGNELEMKWWGEVVNRSVSSFATVINYRSTKQLKLCLVLWFPRSTNKTATELNLEKEINNYDFVKHLREIADIS